MPETMTKLIAQKRQGFYYLTGTAVGVVGTWIKHGSGDALMLLGFLLIILSLLATSEVDG